MSQEVKLLKIKDLVLWTENPRDPISEKAKDQDIVNMALDDDLSKWTLAKLAKEMGDYYDFSELPTVVYHGEKPVVYDGNRRLILGKLKHGFVSAGDIEKLNIPNIPAEIPCNVCSKDIALKNIYRKHSDSGSWHPLERDIFLHKFMGEKQSPFLILEEGTGLISSNPHLNQRFVKDEILKEDILSAMGFEIKDSRLFSVHDDEESYSILSDISQKIANKRITTRKNRGKVLDILDNASRELINKNKDNNSRPANIQFSSTNTDTNEGKTQRQSRRIGNREQELFGGKLYLRTGDVSNLYRDIADLYQFYVKNKAILSSSFPSLIRMSLRLLCESAAKDSNKNIDKYIKSHFAKAKQTLDQDMKTTLSNQNVNEGSIIQLLHTGAHHYQSANNMIQTIAISLVLGEILTATHGKKD